MGLRGHNFLSVRNGERIRLNVPVALLPEGCKEGDILDILITTDEKETEKSKARILGLIKKLKKKSQCGPSLFNLELG